MEVMERDFNEVFSCDEHEQFFIDSMLPLGKILVSNNIFGKFPKCEFIFCEVPSRYRIYVK